MGCRRAREAKILFSYYDDVHLNFYFQNDDTAPRESLHTDIDACFIFDAYQTTISSRRRLREFLFASLSPRAPPRR